MVTIFRRGEVVRLCETWHSRPICRRLHGHIWASPTPYKNLIGSPNWMDPITSKVVGSGPKIRVEIDGSGWPLYNINASVAVDIQC